MTLVVTGDAGTKAGIAAFRNAPVDRRQPVQGSSGVIDHRVDLGLTASSRSSAAVSRHRRQPSRTDQRRQCGRR